MATRTPVLTNKEGNRVAHYHDLDGKVVVVTGAAGGIGSAAVQQFSDQGALVQAVDMTQACVPENGSAHVADISNPEEIEDVVATIISDYGAIDVWINNAGFMERRPALELDLAAWNKTLSINLTGTFFGAQAAAKEMSGGGGGSIINLSSYAGLKPRPNCADYAATKAAVAHLTSCLALEWGELGIRVNAIAPGYIDTPMSSWMHANRANYKKYVEHTPLKRLGDPSEIAQSMLYLASDASSFVTGETILVDGGISRM